MGCNFMMAAQIEQSEGVMLYRTPEDLSYTDNVQQLTYIMRRVGQRVITATKQ